MAEVFGFESMEGVAARYELLVKSRMDGIVRAGIWGRTGRGDSRHFEDTVEGSRRTAVLERAMDAILAR